MNLNLTANFLGILSLLAVAIAMSPILINLFKLPVMCQRSLWQAARFGLMFAVCVGLVHGLLMTQQENIDFYNLDTYWIYAVGLFTFNLLAMIALMYGELKLEPKKLNYLSCGALLLLAFHLGQRLTPIL